MTAVTERFPELRVEFCRNEDVPALMQFIATQWRAGHILSRDEALLRWQFPPERLDRTRDSGPTILLAWVGNDIVGMLGLTGFVLNLAGRRFTAAWLSQWLAAPQQRRHMPGLRLVWAAQQTGVDALATSGANSVAAPLLARLGLTALPPLLRWVGVFGLDDAARLAGTADPTLSTQEARTLCRQYWVAERPPVAANGMRLVSWSVPAADSWDRSWNEHFAHTYVGACRDAAFLRWRYREHPRFTYQVRFVEREADAASIGVVVWRVEQLPEHSTSVVRIVELLGIPEGEALLTHAVCDVARESGAAWADFYCSSRTFAEPLVRVGFGLDHDAVDRSVFPARLQPVEPGVHPILPLVRLPRGERIAERRFYITKADADQDRPN